jgi:hypothetical protein
VAPRKHWAGGRRLVSGPVLGLVAALGAALAAAGCTSAPARTDHGPGPAPGSSASGRTASPAITAAQARQVFDRYVAAAANPTAAPPALPLLSLVTGVERAVLTATLGSHGVTSDGTASTGSNGSTGQSAYRSSLTVKPGLDVYTYGPPTFYVPEAADYPRFFVTSVTRTLPDTKSAGAPRTPSGTATGPDGSDVPLDGPVLMLFSQAGKAAPWLLASSSQLPAGVTLPKLTTDSAGYVPTVPLTDAALLAQPDDAGPLQAAVVDDGPSSAATKAVAAGPLTTGLYFGARDHVDGMTAPPGDVYQWELGGSSLPEFALRTAAGGALVFYAMTQTTTVAVPDVVNKANPIHPGPPIQIPLALKMLLPVGQPDPLVQLSSGELLSFAAVDPAQGNAKLQVIAIGGGLTSASAS